MKIEPGRDGCFSTSDAAKALRCSPQKILQDIMKGKLEARQNLDGLWRIEPRHLRDYIDGIALRANLAAMQRKREAQARYSRAKRIGARVDSATKLLGLDEVR